MGQTRLAMLHPVLIHAVAIADEDALPIIDQGEKGIFGTVGMNEIQGHGIGRHGPQPLQSMVAIPGRFIDVAHWSLARQGGNRVIMGRDGLRGSVNHLLHRSQADGKVQDRVAEVLNEAPRAPMHRSQCADESR
jgi:hypothetical protein